MGIDFDVCGFFAPKGRSICPFWSTLGCSSNLGRLLPHWPIVVGFRWFANDPKVPKHVCEEFCTKLNTAHTAGIQGVARVLFGTRQPWLVGKTECEGHRMNSDLLTKARGGRLKALEKLGYRHSIETNVLPMMPRTASKQPNPAADLRGVFSDTSATEPSAPLA